MCVHFLKTLARPGQTLREKVGQIFTPVHPAAGDEVLVRHHFHDAKTSGTEDRSIARTIILNHQGSVDVTLCCLKALT